MSTVVSLIFSFVLLAMSGLFSGLTLGLLSLNIFELKRKAELGDVEAQLVYPIRARGNELLVTLIVGNVLVNSALTIFLDNLLPGDAFVSGLIAVILSTVLITVFGEIIPQAVLKQHGLSFGARISGQINFVLEILRPVASPLGRLLDKHIGSEIPTVYSTNELIKIIEEHEASDDSDIEADEVAIVRNAISFGDKKIKDVMTPKSVVSAIARDEVLSPAVLKELHDTGHSRFPVYDEEHDDVVGTLYLRDLLDINRDKTKVHEAMDTTVYFVNEDQALDHALNAFIQTKHHLFIVINSFKEMTGIVTIEDIIEEIMGREIVDEFDKYDDMREVASLQAKKKQPNGNVIGKTKRKK